MLVGQKSKAIKKFIDHHISSIKIKFLFINNIDEGEKKTNQFSDCNVIYIFWRSRHATNLMATVRIITYFFRWTKNYKIKENVI